MIRILHITGAMQRAGAETLLMNLYRNLDTNNFQFDFLYFTASKCDYDDEIKKLGGNIYRIPNRGKNRLSRIWKRYVDYAKLIKSLPDHQVIHSHINLNGTVFLLIAYLQKKKVRVSHSHISKGKKTLRARIYRFICRRLIKKSCNVYMACGEAAGEYLYPSIPKEKVVVFPNSIDINFFQGQEKYSEFLRKELNLKENTKIVTQIGRFTFQKNFEFTINFVSELVKRHHDIHYVFLGTGPLENKLKKMVKDRDLEKVITFYGISSEIPKILHSSDIFFMPSNLEGFPVVLVEAQACGLPCIISTNISSEVDMGLDLITFLDLNENLKVWEQALLDSFKKKSTDFEKIKSQMRLRNFDAADSVKKLQHIYSEGINS
ncbi:glycosyltransferase [Flagellimonas sp. 389]|uniref:glycosyltransferase n=1 Tax=Flagellimonas sp. 389 TaxID=2835862 RepID=UPI001BD68362|nr:glycosyltransferase [Flagellimonas sp. 389]MBS9462200.1 glycosyltransferase [Flagellimonas sp. 389]